MAFAGTIKGLCWAGLLVVFAFGGRARGEEGLAIGFGDFGGELNVVSSSHPAAQVLRAAVGEGLVSLRRRSDGAPPPGRFELALADSVQVSAGFDRWSFRVRRGVTFQSGRPIGAEDVVFSLARCRDAGGVKTLKKSVSRRVKTPYDALEEWVDLEVESVPDIATTFPVDVARCPIWESSSAGVFGGDFGRGSNFVSAGRYRLVGYRPGKQYSLARIGRAEQVDVAGYAQVTLRSFTEATRGLTALREGTIALLFTEDTGVLDKAKRDETLVRMSCAGSPVLRRRDVVFSCEPSIDVAHLRVGR